MNEQEDSIIIGYCEECGNFITEDDEMYIDEEGRYFCSQECALEYYHIIKREA